MTSNQIFAHESGGTFRMEHTLVCTGRDHFSHARKPVALVSDATREAERGEADFYGFAATNPEITNAWKGVKAWASFVTKRIQAGHGVSDEYPWSVY